MKKDTMIHIKISKEDKELINTIAEKECRCISSMIRFLIKEAANKYGAK